MNTGIYSAVGAQVAAERELESITSNLANLSTIGYKRRGAATESFDQVLHGRLQRQIQTRQTVDFSQGEITFDGEATDLALEGPGFFTVESPTGEAYTRNGRFLIDEQGVLQSFEGYAVAWEGARQPINPRGEPLTVDVFGAVRQGADEVGRLQIKNFGNPETLKLDRVGYLHADPLETVETPHEATVVHGALERANVSPIEEMTRMILVQRRFESAAHVLSMLDQSYRRLNQGR